MRLRLFLATLLASLALASPAMAAPPIFVPPPATNGPLVPFSYSCTSHGFKLVAVGSAQYLVPSRALPTARLVTKVKVTSTFSPLRLHWTADVAMAIIRAGRVLHETTLHEAILFNNWSDTIVIPYTSAPLGQPYQVAFGAAFRTQGLRFLPALVTCGTGVKHLYG